MSMRKLLVVGIAVASLGLAGCGGDSSGNGDGNNASSGVDPTADNPTASSSSGGGSGSGTTDDPAPTTVDPDTTTGQATTEDPVDPPILFDVLDDPTGGAGGCQGAPNNLALEGTVWAPNGVIPVSVCVSNSNKRKNASSSS